jgi:hypothetical protein
MDELVEDWNELRELDNYESSVAVNFEDPSVFRQSKEKRLTISLIIKRL